MLEEWDIFCEKAEAEYFYCRYMDEYIEIGYCYDLQMILNSVIQDSALPELRIDKEILAECCKDCAHNW